MKKIILLSFTLLFLFTTTALSSETRQDGIKIFLNNTLVSSEARVIDNKLYIPASTISEAFQTEQDYAKNKK